MALLGGIVKSLFGDDGAANSRAEAIKAIRGVRVPTAEEMQVQLQQLVEAGVLTPERAQYFAQNPSEFANIVMPTEGRDAQTDSLAGLRNIVEGGGNDAQMEADKAQILNDLRMSQKGSRDALMQQQAARGGLKGGMALAAQLAANQQDVGQANKNALDANAAAEARKMDALRSMASIGQGLASQDWQQQAQRAQAADAINQFNAANQNAMSQFNTNAANAAAASNLQNKQGIMNQNTGMENSNRIRNADLKQQAFNNNMNKANALSGQYNQQANAQQQSANQNMAFIGSLAGSAMQAAAGGAGGAGAGAGGASGAMASPNLNLANGSNPYSTYKNPFMAHGGKVCMTEGGEVPGEAPFPGDTEANDIVEANLSPGEVVIPRTVADDPNAAMDFLMRIKKTGGMTPKGPNTQDVLTVLQALTQMRNEEGM